MEDDYIIGHYLYTSGETVGFLKLSKYFQNT